LSPSEGWKSNNIAENRMRCIAVGRKNYLFAGSDTDGERAASIYTIVRTAKLNGLNPETYLRGVLRKIAEGHKIKPDICPFACSADQARPPDNASTTSC